ncbi:MAG: flagellar basal-body MS-ring/collar protein FliF [Vampirovibrionales bacterium]
MNPVLFFLKQVLTRFNAMTFNQKVVVGTLTCATIFAGVYIWQQAGHDYDVLYSNLTLPDAAAAVAKLKANKVPYELADGGTTILVPRDQKNQMVLETASDLQSDQVVSLAKIPPVLQGEVQDEWIKKLNTDAVAQAIQSIQGIKHAHVIISEPKETVFTEEKQDSSASVMLIVTPGFRLNEAMVKTIKNLVVHAVAGMKPENVSIADNMGNSLDASTGGGLGLANGMTLQEQRRRTYEEYLKKKVQSILDPIVGKENAVVSVTAQMNFDESESRVERVLPANDANPKDTVQVQNANGSAMPLPSPTGVVLSEQEQTEEYKGTKPDASAKGEPGVASNVMPSYQAEENNNGKNGKDYKFQKRTVNYAESREERATVHASGNLERLTVGIAINKVLTNRDKDELKELIANAAGLDFNRGDSVDVKGFAFSDSPVSTQKEYMKLFRESQQQQLILNLLYGLLLLALGGGALFVVYRMVNQNTNIDALWHNLETPPTPASLLPPGGKLLPPSASGKLIYQTADGDLIPVAPNPLGYGGLTIPDSSEDEADEPYPDSSAPSLRPSEELLKLLPPSDPDMEYIKQTLRDIIMADPEDCARLLVGYMKEY